MNLDKKIKMLVFSTVLVLGSCTKWIQAGQPEMSMAKCSITAREYEAGLIQSVQLAGSIDALCKAYGKDRSTGKARCKETEMSGDVALKGTIEVECK